MGGGWGLKTGLIRIHLDLSTDGLYSHPNVINVTDKASCRVREKRKNWSTHRIRMLMAICTR